MRPPDGLISKYADRLIWVLIIAYTCLFTWLCFLKYASFGYFDWDFASDITVLWNTTHGKILYYPFLDEIIFGAHLYLFIFLIIPIYALFQHPVILLFLQALFLGLGAYPLYLIAKLKTDKVIALAVSLAYLLYPPLGHINIFETHFDSYVIFFLLFAFYYFEKEKFNKFLCFLLLALSCKENIGPVVFMFGFYSAVRKRPLKWVLTPIVLGAAWFFIAVKLIIPYFARDAKLYNGGFMFSVFYQHLGNSFTQIAKTILFHPLPVLRFALTPEKITYLFLLFIPTGLIGLLSPAVLLPALPIFMQNLLSSFGTHSRIFYQYTAALIPFIFLSVVFSFKKLMSSKLISANRNGFIALFLLFPVMSGLYAKGPQVYFAEYIKSYPLDDLVRQKDRMIRAIPKDASVIATFQFLPKLAQRHKIYSMHLVSSGRKMFTNAKYEPPMDLNYALMDFNEPGLIANFFPPEAPANICDFIEKNNFSVFKAADDIVLFRKNYENGLKICQAAGNPAVANEVNAVIDNEINFLGYDFIDGPSNEGRILHFAFYWKLAGRPSGRLGYALQFLDADSKIVLTKLHSFGYRVYPPQDWPKNQAMKEHRFILIPSRVKSGRYSMKMVFFSLDDGKQLSDQINLGDIAVN